MNSILIFRFLVFSMVIHYNGDLDGPAACSGGTVEGSENKPPNKIDPEVGEEGIASTISSHISDAVRPIKT